jgi:hypothetical protein
MVTIIIKDKTAQAKQMVEFLKTQSYAEIIEDDQPNARTIKSMNEAKHGKVIRAKNTAELLEKLKK